MRILVDADVLVDHLRGHRRFAPGRDDVHVSTITRAELFAGRGSEEGKVRRLLGPMTELVVDSAIADRAGRLRRGTSTRLPDALIAATAIEHGLTLVTRNARDFEEVRGLRLRVPPRSSDDPTEAEAMELAIEAQHRTRPSRAGRSPSRGAGPPVGDK